MQLFASGTEVSTHVNVRLVTLEMGSHVMTSTNAKMQVHVLVKSKQLAKIQMAVLFANAMKDLLKMVCHTLTVKLLWSLSFISYFRQTHM